MASELLEAWRMSHEANIFLLSAIPPGHLGDRYAHRTRTVARQFAHLHDVRLRWLRHAAPEFAGDLEGFPRGTDPTKTQLKRALNASARAMGEFLVHCEEQGSVPAWQGSPPTFLSYLVAHEAHHRGLAMVAIRVSGHKLAADVVYGQWDWGKKRSRR